MKIITSDNHDRYGPLLREAAAALRAGALVLFPTETVYGVAANALDVDAMKRLREIKEHRDGRAFTVHLPGRPDARRYVGSPAPLARRLSRKAWPGPLTLICSVPSPEREMIARECSAQQLAEIYHDNKVGLRCPDHAMACDLLREAGVPVVASSANRGGSPPPLDVSDALHNLDSAVEFALDGGPTRFSSSSTIVEIDGDEWSLRRTGVIDERTIRRMAVSEIVMVCTGNSCRSPLAEYLFRHKLAQRLRMSADQLARAGYVVSSAGTAAFDGGPISRGSRDELARRGIDAADHRSQPLTVELIQRAERIFTMSPEHTDAVLDLVPSARDRVQLLDANGAVSDPIGGGADRYHACAEQIERAVNTRLEEFLNEDRDW